MSSVKKRGAIAFWSLLCFSIISFSHGLEYYHSQKLSGLQENEAFEYCLENDLRHKDKFIQICKNAFYKSTERFWENLYDPNMVLNAATISVGTSKIEN